MSRIKWQWRDEGSGPGHMQKVIVHDPAGQAEYKAFMDHCQLCPDCGFGQTRCPAAERMWEAWKAARSKRA